MKMGQDGWRGHWAIKILASKEDRNLPPAQLGLYRGLLL